MEQSLAQKFSFLNKTLEPWSKSIEQVRSVDEIERWHYRSKVSLNADWQGGRWTFGTLSRDEFIPIPQCPVHSPIVARTIAILEAHLPNPSNFTLAFLLQTQAQCILVLKQKDLPTTHWFTLQVEEELRQAGVEGFWIHLNPSAGRRMFEKTTWINLFGEKLSQDEQGLWYGPGAFQQLIPRLYLDSIRETSAFLNPTANSAVVDLYCGTGTTLREWTRKGAVTLGIELGGEAVECAKLNVPKAEILRGACRQRVPQIALWANKARNAGNELLLYVNPPRTGIEPEVLQWIVNEGKPRRIAYLSCSPGTLSKNLKFLCENGYRVSKIVPFDFFPQTKHVESLVLLNSIKILPQ
jgi:tRNA/tmRNA/rRNA uracil-C5-methylase (TrmA/RlmC/RlmD family)